MRNRANPALIGLFVLTGMGLAALSIVLFGSGRLFSHEEEFILYFDDSIGGLDKGAPVMFRGVPIGQVRDIFIRFNQAADSPHIPVVIAIDTDRLQRVHNVSVDLGDEKVYRTQVDQLGLRGILQQGSFVTGKLFIELDYYPDAPPPTYIQQPSESTGKLAFKEIPTLESGLTEVIKKVSHMINEISNIEFAAIGDHLESILFQIDQKLTAFDARALNAAALQSLASLESLLNDPALKRVPGRVDEALAVYTEVGNQIQATLANVDQIVNSLDHNLTPLAQSVNESLASLRETLSSVQSTVEQLSLQTSPGAPIPRRIEEMLAEVASAARSLRQFADYLERHPNALLTGRSDNK